jgi:uncharacterized membrane protein
VQRSFFSLLVFGRRFDKKLLTERKSIYDTYHLHLIRIKERSIFYIQVSFSSDFFFLFFVFLFFGIKYMRTRRRRRRRRRRICIGTTIAILYICVWVRVMSKNENEVVVFIIWKKGKQMLELRRNIPYWRKKKRIEWHSCAFRS